MEGAHSTNLHSYDSVDEKEHHDEKSDVRKSLERFDKRPQQGPNALASAQQFDETHHAKEPEEVDGNNVGARLKNIRQIHSRFFWINRGKMSILLFLSQNQIRVNLFLILVNHQRPNAYKQ